MRTLSILLALTPLALCLGGCGKADNDPGPGGVTNGEARALDDAAAIIEQRRMPPGALHSATPMMPSAPAPSATP